MKWIELWAKIEVISAFIGIGVTILVGIYYVIEKLRYNKQKR